MEDANEDGDCIYDYVKVYKGQNDYIEENLLVSQCGTKTTASLTDVYKSNQGKVLFVAFQNVTNKGFAQKSFFYSKIFKNGLFIMGAKSSQYCLPWN